MATSQPNASLSRRAGRATSRAWRWLLFQDRRFIAWMVAVGAPARLANGVGACVLLLVVGALLYFAFWMGVVLVTAMAVVWLAIRIDVLDTTEETRWRDGIAGYGLYRGEVRIDPGEEEEP
ncbi:DUF3742 family protein [Xanthomonas phaseoli pv. dieffenbachiae]|uniref:DUF3742 family protein n=1 Tax=Xanthomonas TaxID=338 RepID=UPI0006E6E158|nr:MULTISPECIES: DUF3742 family protein [Xanthomonas]MBO9749325.1 DUF3742 family protein [Xanthomonas phaseoli pv. dieffenbachiae]MBO9753409.1 DUF3742 family protein [Xanthomonas phaseoli pv. dieffenbachiae]MBO9891581.1 DUF3742 family protein [Xanthomonas sp. D-36-1]OQP82492.1 hypothetical protein IB69_020230 [Xanthomonas citri]